MCTVPLPKVSIATYVEIKLNVASSGSLASGVSLFLSRG